HLGLRVGAHARRTVGRHHLPGSCAGGGTVVAPAGRGAPAAGAAGRGAVPGGCGTVAARGCLPRPLDEEGGGSRAHALIRGGCAGDRDGCARPALGRCRATGQAPAGRIPPTCGARTSSAGAHLAPLPPLPAAARLAPVATYGQNRNNGTDLPKPVGESRAVHRTTTVSEETRSGASPRPSNTPLRSSTRPFLPDPPHPTAPSPRPRPPCGRRLGAYAIDGVICLPLFLVVYLTVGVGGAVTMSSQVRSEERRVGKEGEC